MRPTIDVLVLDGAAHSSLAVVRNLGQHGLGVAVGADVRLACAAASTYCAEFLLHPPLARDSRAALDCLVDYLKKRSGVVIMPNSDRWHHACYAGRDAIESTGAILAVPPEASFRAACDKAETLARAQKLGVPSPDTHIVNSIAELDDLARRIHYPVVVKARQSVVRKNHRLVKTGRVRYARSPAELVRAYRDCHAGQSATLIQRFIPGRGMGVFLLCDRGRPVMRFAHRRIRDVVPTGSASALRQSVAYPTDAGRHAERLAADLEFTGPMMVEFRVDAESGCAVLMEINGGRFWGSLQLAIDAGQEFPHAWYRMARGETVNWPDEYAVGVCSRWLVGDIQSLVRALRGRPPGYMGEFPTRFAAVRDFLAPWPRPTRLEVLRRGDIKPFCIECAHYAARLVNQCRINNTSAAAESHNDEGGSRQSNEGTMER